MSSVYRIITKEKELDDLIRCCEKTNYASVDFETNGQPFYASSSYPTILGVSYQPGSSIIIPLGHKESPFKDKFEKLLTRFGKNIIENPDIIKVAWNFQFEDNWFKKYGIQLNGRADDAMLAKYILDEERPMGLKQSVERFIPEFSGYDLKGQPSSKSNPENITKFWSNVEINELSKYCGLDTDNTLRLMLFFYDKMNKHDLYLLYRNMLMMGSRVLADSKFRGMDINKPYLYSLDEKYQRKIDKSDKKMRSIKKIAKVEKKLISDRIEKEVSKIEGEILEIKSEIKEQKKLAKKGKLSRETVNKFITRKKKTIESREDKIDKLYARELTTKKDLKLLEPINFKSNPQMIELLYESKHGFKFKVKNHTDSGNPSTDEDTLKMYEGKDKSGFITRLLNHRGLTNLHSTYILGPIEKLSEDEKLHANFLLHGTVTGRLSSRGPNLQNVPRVTTNPDIKQMFIPPDGELLLQLDYSQAELRVFAAQAGETTMIQWFKDGRDIHLATACDKEGWDYDKRLVYLKDEDHEKHIETVKSRKYAKTINFGIIYGQGPFKLAEGMGISLEEAKIYLKEYFKRFPRIKHFINKQHIQAHKEGYVKNVFGRKRRLWNALNSPNKWEVAEAERQSVNAPIQGAASDYTLFSSILIWEKCKFGEIPYMPQVYTVHDSLGYYIKPENVHKVVPILRDICANPETMEWFGFQIDDVTMKVDFEISESNWANLKNYNPNTDYVKLVNEFNR